MIPGIILSSFPLRSSPILFFLSFFPFLFTYFSSSHLYILSLSVLSSPLLACSSSDILSFSPSLTLPFRTPLLSPFSLFSPLPLSLPHSFRLPFRLSPLLSFPHFFRLSPPVQVVQVKEPPPISCNEGKESLKRGERGEREEGEEERGR